MKPTEFANYPGDAAFAVIDDITHINHKPHPFMIGTRHVDHAHDHHGGMLGESTLRQIPCAMSGCGLPYNQHTSDHVACIKLQRNCTNSEIKTWVQGLVDWCTEHKIDGFVMIENHGYRVREDANHG